MLSHSSQDPLIDDPNVLSKEEYERRRLRTGHKLLSMMKDEPPPPPPRDMDRDGSRREIAHYLSDESYESAPPINYFEIEKAQHEMEKLIGFDEISRNMRPKEAPPKIKDPSTFLPAENVINKKDAFHAGAKTGSASFLFYRMHDYLKALFKKRPWPRSGAVAYRVDIMRNEVRQINKNIKRLLDKFERLKANNKNTLEYRRTKAALIVFLLEENYYKLKAALSNLKMFNGLLKGNATIGIMNTIVRGKEAPGKPDPFFVERDEFYAQELDLLERLSRNGEDVIADVKEQLAHFELTAKEYEEWKEKNWREVRMLMNRYRGAGAMLAQGLQGLVISLINAGIAIGTKSLTAASAAVFYFLTTVARVIELGVRTHLENNLIKHSKNLHDENTILTNKSSKEIKQTHAQIRKLYSAEVAVNEIEGLANSGFNASGLVTGPLSTGRPPVPMQPIESLNAPLLGRIHRLWGRQDNSKPVSNYRRGFTH